MNTIEQFFYDEIVAAIAGIDANTRADIYALSFFIYDIDDDPRFPGLTVGYNTRANAAQAQASDAAEGKWNYAFWLQNSLIDIGGPETAGGQLFEEAMAAAGRWYSDDEEDEDFDRCMSVGEEITGQFVALCVAVAQRLHRDGIIGNSFQPPVPIIVHELEYHEAIAAQTERANPAGLADEFTGWVRSLGG
jgi:hypothetical protein